MALSLLNHKKSVSQCGFLQFENFVHAFLRQLQHRVQLFWLERRAFGGALDFNEAASAGHHHVQVSLGSRIFQVVEVKHRLALVHANRNSRDHLLERVAAFQAATLLDHFQGINQGNHGAGDGCGAGAAIGLDNIAIDVQGDIAQFRHVQRCAQGTTNQTLDLQSTAALLATARFTLVTLAGGARQHAVFGGQPALALPLEETRHAIFDADRADDLGITELDQYRSLGVFGVVAGNADRAELIGNATTWTFHREYLYWGRKTAEHYRAASRTWALLKSRPDN